MTEDEPFQKPFPDKLTTDAAPEEVFEEVGEKIIPLSSLPRALFSRRWWWTTLLVLAAMAVMSRLGVWQLNRLEQRRERNAEYLAQLAQPPFSLNDGGLPAEPIDLRDRQAEATGLYDFDRQLVLTQQSYQGGPGAHLITPLQLSGSSKSVLVDRGWIRAADLDSGDLARFDEPGQLTVVGAVQLSQVLSGDRQSIVDGPQRDWYRVDIEAIQGQMPYELLPFFLLQSPPEGVQLELPFRVKPDIDLTEGSHMSYAIQWFLFTTILALGYANFVRKH